MLEQFKVSHDDAEFVQGDDLKKTVAGIFEKLGVNPEDALLAADVQVLADLRGVDSHGVSNMLKSYITGYQEGSINPRPNWKVVRETPSTATVDSDKGLGTIITPKAMDIAIQKAKNVGVGMVTIGNARHLGMASYHAMLALPHDMIGICMTSCPPQVLPTFGAEPRLGTNPIAIAVPAKNEPPFVFDVATSSVAVNKIRIAARLGAEIPGGWMAREDGSPIMESGLAPEKFTLLPLGADREGGSHKGYGFSCMVDILAGVLTGFGYGAVPGRPNFGHMVAAYSIDAFTDVEPFKAEMDEWLQMMKSTKPAPGHDRVLVAGQPEAEVEVVRRDEGIPLHPDVADWIRDTCGEMSVPCLF
ncbi:MAG: Ldh family oxidoreductase [Dehalococcoidia bacterium]|nr:Ldh family oxidoreductase [Dehalococcoidia bacterium]|tara:strand:- start:6470 stop:7546 length:1077 start_codon:yes stop_codon:yes gene_type:complete